jgi:hypothetical protein
MLAILADIFRVFHQFLSANAGAVAAQPLDSRSFAVHH